MSSPHTADNFARFFTDKVEAVRSSTGGVEAQAVLPPAPSSLADFRQYSEEEILQTVHDMPTKSCALDPIPTFLLKDLVPCFAPFLTAMCNASLKEGNLPVSQRHALVTPLLKKSNLDSDQLTNYRPVSNLTFMSKVIERLVARQLTNYLLSNALMPVLQSAYRKDHSTETALLRVTSDILFAADQGQVTLLSLLDLSAAFDTVDHDLLLQRLSTTFGINGVAHDWITSFLTNRTQQVVHGGVKSAHVQLTSGVPQGSVLGPLLFVLYTAELSAIIKRHGLIPHCYADDIQIYLSAPAADAGIVAHRITDCIADIDRWMTSNRLKLNAGKTQLMWIGSRRQLAKVNITDVIIGTASVRVSTSVTDLGVALDGELSMSAHVSSLCRTCFFQLRQIRAVRRSLDPESTKTLVNAFISSRLDYCNSLLYGINEGQLNKLQRVQNAAARLISGALWRDHIKPVLHELHWLPIRERIRFKIATLVYKSLHSAAPSYVAELCTVSSTVPGRSGLRSSGEQRLLVPYTQSARLGSRPFAVCGPNVWNSLPATLRNPTLSLEQFRGRLKTELFVQCYG